MGVIKESDLQYEYSDTATGGDNPNIRDYRDKMKLNRHESYEVLDFINSFCEEYGLGKDDALEIEDYLQFNVPSKMVMKSEIVACLKKELDL